MYITNGPSALVPTRCCLLPPQQQLGFSPSNLGGLSLRSLKLCCNQQHLRPLAAAIEQAPRRPGTWAPRPSRPIACSTAWRLSGKHWGAAGPLPQPSQPAPPRRSAAPAPGRRSLAPIWLRQLRWRPAPLTRPQQPRRRAPSVRRACSMAQRGHSRRRRPSRSPAACPSQTGTTRACSWALAPCPAPGKQGCYAGALLLCSIARWSLHIATPRLLVSVGLSLEAPWGIPRFRGCSDHLAGPCVSPITFGLPAGTAS